MVIHAVIGHHRFESESKWERRRWTCGLEPDQCFALICGKKLNFYDFIKKSIDLGFFALGVHRSGLPRPGAIGRRKTHRRDFTLESEVELWL